MGHFSDGRHWMGKLAARDDGDPVRETIFCNGDARLQPRMPEGRRKQGRPKNLWVQQIYLHAVRAAGNADALRRLARQRHRERRVGTASATVLSRLSTYVTMPCFGFFKGESLDSMMFAASEFSTCVCAFFLNSSLYQCADRAHGYLLTYLILLVSPPVVWWSFQFCARVL